MLWPRNAVGCRADDRARLLVGEVRDGVHVLEKGPLPQPAVSGQLDALDVQIGLQPPRELAVGGGASAGMRKDDEREAIGHGGSQRGVAGLRQRNEPAGAGELGQRELDFAAHVDAVEIELAGEREAAGAAGEVAARAIDAARIETQRQLRAAASLR